MSGKLHNEVVSGAPVPSLKSEPEYIPDMEVPVKVDDWVSSGSGGSSLVDGDSPHILDSGDSYFLQDIDYPELVATTIQSEDDASDDGRGYLMDVFGALEQQEIPLGWWVWS